MPGRSGVVRWRSFKVGLVILWDLYDRQPIFSETMPSQWLPMIRNSVI